MLRQRLFAKQEQDHGPDIRAMLLRGRALRSSGLVARYGPQTRRRPGKSGAPTFGIFLPLALGGSFGVNHLGLSLAFPNRDLTRLFCLGDLAYEVDVQ